MKFSRILAAAIVCGSALSSCSNGPKKVSKLNNETDSVSYALGYNTGTSYSQNLEQFPGGADKVDKDILIAGFINGLNGDSTKTLMDRDEAMKTIQEYFNKQQKKEEDERKEAYLASKSTRDEYMANKSKEEGFVKVYPTPVGPDSAYILMKVEKEGKGDKIQMQNIAIVNYKGTLTDGKEFDANQNTPFPVNRVIKGFSTGLQQMSKGGKATFVIPSELGYGMEQVGDIPANSILTFDVEVVEVCKDDKEAMDFMRKNAPKPEAPAMPAK